MRLAAYVYTGWHPIPERDESFHAGFTEWELVRDCQPRFDGHAQPRVPLLGAYDDRDPHETGRRLELALQHGVDAFVYGVFWCRGKRVFEGALDQGFLGSEVGSRAPFALMWANRMPRRVLPVRRPEAAVIDPARRVTSDVEDFVDFVSMLADRYFQRPNYIRVGGAVYLSLFDSTFFIQELGVDGARAAVTAARERLREVAGLELHLAAVEPNAACIGDVASIGFDSVTHYVFLPEWKGPSLQDYREMAARREGEWSGFGARSGLPYMPSVAPGWDASPRGADFGKTRPDRYPWSPIITGEHPEHFQEHLSSALALPSSLEDPLVFVASLNEWSEGHYLEPDDRFGLGWLEAVARARTD